MKSIVAILVICILSQFNPVHADVCENGLCIEDTSSGNSGWSLHGDWIHAGGIFTFGILGYDNNRSADIDKIKYDGHFDIPISKVKYYNISETTINGWPAVVGYIVTYGVLDSYQPTTTIKGYIYIRDYKIGFTGDCGGYLLPSHGGSRLDSCNVSELLRHITITVEPGLDLRLHDSEGKSFPKDHLAKEQAECEAKCDIEYNESQLECGSGQCGDKRDYNICLADCQKWADRDAQYELERDIKRSPLIITVKPGCADFYINPGVFSSTDIVGYESCLNVGDLKMTFAKSGSESDECETDKENLTSFMTKDIPTSDIAYFNVNETTIGGWPAIVGVLNRTQFYASGRSDSPIIEVNAIIYVNNTKILAETSGIQDGHHKLYGIEVSEKKMLEDMKSIKITPAPMQWHAAAPAAKRTIPLNGTNQSVQSGVAAINASEDLKASSSNNSGARDQSKFLMP